MKKIFESLRERLPKISLRSRSMIAWALIVTVGFVYLMVKSTVPMDFVTICLGIIVWGCALGVGFEGITLWHTKRQAKRR